MWFVISKFSVVFCIIISSKNALWICINVSHACYLMVSRSHTLKSAVTQYMCSLVQLANIFLKCIFDICVALDRMFFLLVFVFEFILWFLFAASVFISIQSVLHHQTFSCKSDLMFFVVSPLSFLVLSAALLDFCMLEHEFHQIFSLCFWFFYLYSLFLRFQLLYNHFFSYFWARISSCLGSNNFGAFFFCCFTLDMFESLLFFSFW